MKIYKSSIENLLAELTLDHSGDKPPVAYIQRHVRMQVGNTRTAPDRAIQVAMVFIEVVVAAWNTEGQALEWRVRIGQAPQGWDTDLIRLQKHADYVIEFIRQIGVGVDFREGLVSDEPILGEWPANMPEYAEPL